MSAEIDRFLATGDAAKKKRPVPATIRRVGLRCTNCGGSHHTVSCPYEKKQGGLHNEDGTKIRVGSICHKPGHTKRTCPELARFGTHNVPDELLDGWDERPDHGGDVSRLTAGAQRELLREEQELVVTGERSLDERLKADRAKAEREVGAAVSARKTRLIFGQRWTTLARRLSEISNTVLRVHEIFRRLQAFHLLARRLGDFIGPRQQLARAQVKALRRRVLAAGENLDGVIEQVRLLLQLFQPFGLVVDCGGHLLLRRGFFTGHE